jgi:penicillin-binding protein 1A
MGIQSPLPDSLSLALGSGEVTPLELTNAFATMAARGVAAPPRFIHAVDGNPLPEPESREVLRPEVAYVMVDMMTSVITEGTGTKALSLGMPVAGKTGTSNDARDAWFMGMTPNYVVGVWIGFDDNRPLGGHEAGGTTALPVFIELMKEIGKDEKRERFAAPEGIHRVVIDKQSGLLAPERASENTVYTEVFVAGTAPTETALAPDAAAASTFVQDEYEDDYGDDYVGGDRADSLDGEGGGAADGAGQGGGTRAKR